MRIEFDQDGILMKGLLNHLGPMIDRIKGNVQLHDDVSHGHLFERFVCNFEVIVLIVHKWLYPEKEENYGYKT